MTDAYGRRRLKWAPEWPMMSRAQAAADNPSPSVQTEIVVFGCAISLVFILVEFHSTWGF
jgi:hypothetical protein